MQTIEGQITIGILVLQDVVLGVLLAVLPSLKQEVMSPTLVGQFVYL